MDILETLKEIFGGMDIDIDSDDITEDTELFDEIGLTRSTSAFLASSIEDEFGIDFSDVDIDNYETVGEIVELIEDRL